MDVQIANFLNCRVCELADTLKKEGVRERVEQAFLGKRIFTIYYNCNRNYKEFSFDGLSMTRADRTYAYANVTVETHFMVRHKIPLKRSSLPCAMHFTRGLIHFYPLELLDLVPHQRHYTRTDMVGMSTLKSRHFRKKSQFRNYLSLVNNHRLPKLLNWYELEDQWRIEKNFKMAPVKLHPTCKSKYSTIRNLCEDDHLSNIIISEKNQSSSVSLAIRDGINFTELYGHTGACDQWALPKYAFPKEEIKIQAVDDTKPNESMDSTLTLCGGYIMILLLLLTLQNFKHYDKVYRLHYHIN